MMSDLAELCYRKFKQHEALATLLETQAIAEDGWGIVIRFYAGLQLINAYLLGKHNVRIDLSAAAHEDRKQAMARCPELRDVPKNYRALKDLSEDVRYDPRFEFAAHHRDDSKKLFARIVAIVEPKLKKGLP